MLRTRLVGARTSDGLVLPGALFEPARRSSTTVVWVPGLGGTFTSRLAATHTLARELTHRGVAFATFNTRGSSTVAYLRARRRGRTRRLALGVAFERFEDAPRDLMAMVRAVRALGHRRVVLLGSSTGANKLAYAAWRGALRGVTGGIMVGPLSDIPGLKRDYGRRRFDRLLRQAQGLERRGRGVELLPPPRTAPMLWSAARFASLATPGKREDTFPYYEPERTFYWVRRWRLPLLVVLGTKDEHLDRPAQAVQRAFDQQCRQLRHYTSALVRGGDHQLTRHRGQLAHLIARWLGSLPR